MPEVKKNESQKDYISRCVKQVINEGRTQEQALGKCYGMWKQGQKVNDSERLLARYYAEYRKIDKIEDKEVCKTLAIEKLTNQGLEYTENLSKIFDNLDKLIDGDCNCKNINDAECVERIQDKFTEGDAEKVKEDFKLEFPIEDILEGLNVELEHKDITHGDLEETAKIVIAHLKERKDYYKKLKKYVETKDGSFLINDAGSFHNKKATIMRDGYYKYLAKEVDNKAFYPMDIVKVYRPAEEVKKAYDRFMELKRIPAIANHPEQDLDLSNNESFKDGEGINPKLKLVNGEMLLDCDLNLTGKTKEFYDKGIKEISCGWHGIYEKVEDESKDYQYIQRFKDFNHIAILERGRCGSTCSIKDRENMNINDEYPIGTVREWEGGRFKKLANGEWEKVEEKGNNQKEVANSGNLKFKILENKINGGLNVELLKENKVRIDNIGEARLDLPYLVIREYDPNFNNAKNFLENKLNTKLAKSDIKFNIPEEIKTKIKSLQIEEKKEYEQKIEKLKNDFYAGKIDLKIEIDEKPNVAGGFESRVIWNQEEIKEKYGLKEGDTFSVIYNILNKENYINRSHYDPDFTKKNGDLITKEVLKKINENQKEKEFKKIKNDEKLKEIFEKANQTNIPQKIKTYSVPASGEYYAPQGIDTYIQYAMPDGKIKEERVVYDNQIKDEVLKMEITKEELEQLVNDKVAEILDAKALEGKETKEEEDLEEEEKEKNAEEVEDAYFESDEDEEDIEKAKGKLKRLKDCYKKMKDKNKTVKDAAIKDFEVEKQKIKDEMIKDNKSIFEVIEKGIFCTKEVNDKLPCEIKAMTIKKVLDKEISVNDVAMETLFEVALKNFKNPIWDNKNKISINDIETIRRNSKKELEEIAIVK